MKIAWTVFTWFWPWSALGVVLWLAGLAITLAVPNGYWMVVLAALAAILTWKLVDDVRLARWAYLARKRYFDPQTDPRARSAIRMLFLSHGQDLYRSQADLVPGLAHGSRGDAVAMAEAMARLAAEALGPQDRPEARRVAVVIRYPGDDWRPYGMAGLTF